MLRNPPVDPSPQRGLPPWLADILVCPLCHGDLAATEGLLKCLGCAVGFEQDHQPAANLMLTETLGQRREAWEERQRETQDYFENLRRRPMDAIEAIHSDYDPIATRLAHYRGRIVDVGGGSGIARHFLPAGVDYVVVDPMVEWCEPRWRQLADDFPCLARAPILVRALAERLPLAARSFDAALAVCTLNHVAGPAAAIADLARVLKPGGKCLVVLEDMEPGWPDLLWGRYPRLHAQQVLVSLLNKILSPLRGWPLEADHLAISETDLVRWTSPDLTIRHRQWVGLEAKGWWGAHLIFELEKAG